ncbi:Y4yA family PLP-dependent enzyme [Rhodopirellula bahusiensis]|uniref:Y4yA family PLP-dependent enzyme n=1 Tax=Rhodopirellula bahusiensis TaxID=2014065 RepID=UPI0032660319
MRRCLRSDQLFDWTEEYGSPLNLLRPRTMRRNVEELNKVAQQRQLDFRVYFARKANKCLGFVDEAIESNFGVDTASENELRQCLQRCVPTRDLICTAAVKSDSLIDLCVQQQVCIAVDNDDELQLIVERASELGKSARIALRLGGFWHRGAKLPTRFGFDIDRDRNLPQRLRALPVTVQGVHFHLDGYDAGQRVSALAEAMDWVERLRNAGQPVSFIDMGGGFPMSYLEDGHQWKTFWSQHRRALLGQRESLTYRGHGLGLSVENQSVVGSPKTYPFFQLPVRGNWLAGVLDTEVAGRSIAHRLSTMNVQLRCEPGRSILDDCGMTVARVEFRKQNADGDWLIGLSMNRTQCRTSSDDFLVDPILVQKDQSLKARSHAKPMLGYLVGAYCTESELISLRKMSFPRGVQRGDLLAFPNTAGYFMHFLESRSHQFPLAKNLIVDSHPDPSVQIDLIDE